MPIKHHFQSGRGDNGDAGAIQPSHWDSDHDLTGLLALLDALAVTPDVVLTINGSNSAALVPTASFAPAFSPTFTGVPIAPTAAAGVNSNQIATCSFVGSAIANLVSSAPTTLDTLNEIATALGNDPNFSATITASLGNRLRIDAAQGLTSGQQAQGRSNLGLGTAATLNVGTGANNVVQLDGSSKLPAVDGSQLTNILFSGAVQYNIAQSLTAPQTLQARQNIAAAASPATRTRTVITTTGSGTYTTPANCKAIQVRMIGGGAGGSGTGSGAGAGVAGGNTTFGTSFMTANGGAAGATGAGGAASGGDINLTGGAGSGGDTNANSHGAPGGSSAFGGGGAGGQQTAAGGNAAPNTGGGGGLGSQPATAAATGVGGGAGGYCEKLITSPAATYSYAVGTGGAGGAAGSGGYAGGNGAAGMIIIDEFY